MIIICVKFHWNLLISLGDTKKIFFIATLTPCISKTKPFLTYIFIANFDHFDEISFSNFPGKIRTTPRISLVNNFIFRYFFLGRKVVIQAYQRERFGAWVAVNTAKNFCRPRTQTESIPLEEFWKEVNMKIDLLLIGGREFS